MRFDKKIMLIYSQREMYYPLLKKMKRLMSICVSFYYYLDANLCII